MAKYTKKWDLQKDVPVVSVFVHTYNHASYIHECLDGILFQETNFSFELIVHDDASTDQTVDIVCEYVEKYPNIIIPVFQEENQFSQGIDVMRDHINPRAQGKYIAFCDGDDYWTDSHKLQKQVSLLESHPDCVMCVAKTKELRLGNEGEEVTYEGLPKLILNFDDFFNGCYLHTSTYVISTVAIKEMYKKWHGKIRLSDTAMRFILSDLGPVIFLPEVVSRYRITGVGIWSKLSKLEQVDEHITLFASFYKHFKKKYRSRFLRRLLKYCRCGIRLCIKNKDIVNGFRYIGLMLKYIACLFR